VLLYTLAKSQACIDGNKRVALILLRAFLYINGARLNGDDDEIAARIIGAAESGRNSREDEIIELTDWLARVIVTTEEAP
jgi:prophage maintenance system killer protein